MEQEEGDALEGVRVVDVITSASVNHTRFRPSDGSGICYKIGEVAAGSSKLTNMTRYPFPFPAVSL